MISDMKFTSIEENIKKIDPKIPISVCLEQSEAIRWESIKQRLKNVNSRARIADFARKSLSEMMDNLEELLNEYDQKNILPR